MTKREYIAYRPAAPGRLVGLALLSTLAGGCAHEGPGVPPPALAERILAPANLDDRPPIVGAFPKLEHPAGEADRPAGTSSQAQAAPSRGPDREPGLDAQQSGVPSEEAVALGPDATKPIGLDEAIALAFQLQPRLRFFQEAIAQARGRGQIAFAPFLPQVTFLTQAFFGENPTRPAGASAVPAPEFGDAPGYSNYQFGELFMQWTLWDFGRTYGRFQQAELGIAIAQLQAVRASQTVAYEVAAAYYQLLQARAARRVGEESVRLAQSILEISRKAFRAGLVERDEVLRAEVQLARARQAVVLANRAERVSVATLNRAIGLNVSAATAIVDRTAEPPFELSLAECLQRAVENRREFQVAQREIEVAQEGVRVARADFAPRFFVQGVVAGEDGHKVRHGTTETGTVNIAWSLFQGGQRLGQRNTADASLRQAAAQAQVVCDTIAFEVNEAYRDIEAAREGLVLARPAITQARENLRLVTRRYATGDATPTDIVDAENSLVRALQDYYTAQYAYLAALARMDYATGLAPFLRPESTNPSRGRTEPGPQ
jgi:outer membrane protein TolC